MPMRTGAQFLHGLKDDREIWLEGERVADVTTHPKLARAARTLGRIYDLQHQPELAEDMAFPSPSSGQPVPLAYIIPNSYDDLIRRRRALEIVAYATQGMMGRSPDYVNIQLTATRQMAEHFGDKEKRFADNIRAFHEYAREQDICMTHAFGHPQVNRGAAVGEQPDPYVPLGIVDTTSEGVIVRGAKSLATLAPFSDELFVPPYRPLRPDAGEEMYALAFCIPVATSGLKFICRESHDSGASLYDHPLAGQYEEMDAMAIFDDVLIPWERVFLYRDLELNNRLVTLNTMWRQYMQQVAVKNIAKLEFILGLTNGIANAINIGVFGHVQEKIAEIIDTAETVRSYLRAAEAEAGPWMGEGIWPGDQPFVALRHWWPDAYVRIIWIVEQLAAGGLMLTPTENDIDGPQADTIGKYYQGAAINARDRVRLFRMAWDLTGTQWGSRQTLYERFFNGDVVRLRQGRYASYDYTRANKALADFTEQCETADSVPDSTDK